MATSMIKKDMGYVPKSRVTLSLANSNIMSVVGGDVELYQLDDRQFLAFISVAIKYSSARAANMPAWKIQLDGTDLSVGFPYFIPCLLDGSNTPYFSFCAENKPYFNNGPALSANAVMRWSGVVRLAKSV